MSVKVKKSVEYVGKAETVDSAMGRCITTKYAEKGNY